MIFYKTSSFGNDFIEIDLARLPAGGTNCAGRKAAVPLGDKGALASAMPRRPLGGPACPQGRHPLGGLAVAICDHQRGVGADGVVFFRIENGKFYFEIFNRDGGGAELSGNGLAGLAAVLFQVRLATSPLVLHAAIGARRVELLERRGPVFRLNVEIGRPDFQQRQFFPFLKDKQDSYVIDGLEFYPVSVGNPHAVVLCPDTPAPARLAVLGKKLESHPMFPARVNVEFVHGFRPENPAKATAALRPASCRVFFYERGVGPTLASSTGSAAVFAVLRRLGKVRDRLDIDLNPAGKEVDSHKAEYPAGEDSEKIAVSWKQGIFIHNFTRLVCRGEYFL